MGQPTERDEALDTTAEVPGETPAVDASSAEDRTTAPDPATDAGPVEETAAPGAAAPEGRDDADLPDEADQNSADENSADENSADGTPDDETPSDDPGAAGGDSGSDGVDAPTATTTATAAVETAGEPETDEPAERAATGAPVASDDAAPSGPDETAPVTSEGDESAPAESALAETAPAETVAADTASAASEPGDTEPADAAPDETEPADTEPAVDEPADAGAPAGEGAGHGQGVPAASGTDGDDDAPYVPRVFAFDPSVSAVVRPDDADGPRDPQAEAAATPPDVDEADEADEADDDTRVMPVVALPDGEAAPDAAEPAAPVTSPDGGPTPAPADPTPTDPAPSEPAPTEPAPTEPAPTEPAPTGPAPADETQVLPPVAPWERPAPVRVSTREGAAPAAAAAAAPGDAAPSAGGFGPVPPDQERVTSPFDGFEEDPPRRGWVRGLLWTGVGVLVLGGLYTGAQWYYSDKVPSGTTVAGVDVGGMTRTAAQDELEATLGARAAEPVTLAAGEATTTLDPATAGLTFDAAATVEELTAFSMNPVRLWQHLTGGRDEVPVVEVDDAALDAQVETLRGSLEAEPVDGTVQFVDGEPTATPASDGTALVADAAHDDIVAGWLVTEGPIELETEPVAPTITQEETDAALAEAQQVVSAPVVVSVGGQSPEIPAEVLAATASYTPTDGALALTFDGPGLVEAVVDRTNDLLTTPDDAHFVFSGGVPVIEGGEPGTTIDPEEIAAAVGTAATGDERTAAVELVESDPEQSRAALEELGVKEKVSEFSTPLTANALRTENLRVGASKVNGQLVRPGETFSLTEALSPITLAGGYHSAGIVQSGMHTEGVGGGLSQMATTTYNAAFFAGLDDVEHRQHSYWFSRYPAGREATIFVGSIDLKFKNDTPYGVLMQSWVGGGQLHVAVWSTKYYEVETTSSGKSNVVEPTTVTHSGPDCEPTPAGNPGFSITTYRKVYRDGELVKDEADHWTYKPDNEVVCAP
ncbi:VanW family protein [Cellulosimicrobium marinum]|uniref:VanW family protein n=1 Tax=Cellulosimicrobium marinum TaxID=1638992 RepID=UPI001E3F435E|nr:VanW family protein [Cellulosimicrobium marinum]MCB7136524.1 VanW family protein [Cellulosimicrobium marinum]